MEGGGSYFTKKGQYGACFEDSGTISFHLVHDLMGHLFVSVLSLEHPRNESIGAFGLWHVCHVNWEYFIYCFFIISSSNFDLSRGLIVSATNATANGIRKQMIAGDLDWRPRTFHIIQEIPATNSYLTDAYMAIQIIDAAIWLIVVV
ncbi:hypothetical protein ACJX0J_009225, partial [Zea mays]